MHQTMNGKSAQKRIDEHAQRYAGKFISNEWSLAYAHEMLKAPDAHKLDLFQIAGLAKATACFQCSTE